MTVIASVDVFDVRFPTSVLLDGSDAMNKDPDYSATYVVVRTDADDELEGHGFTFTIGRGNELCVEAVRSVSPRVIGLSLSEIRADMAGFWRHVTGDSQLRWLGPDKGVIHLATAAVVNAVWDLCAKRDGKPLWKMLADMTPAELVGCVDFTYITDAITPPEAIDLLAARQANKDEREAHLRGAGYPAYITSAGWLGYSKEKVRRLCRTGIDEGWTAFKMKVGGDLDEDVTRAGAVRAEIGPDRTLMMDANQRWDVQEAIDWMADLARFNPLWIEEPTSPDDILGHAAIARAVAPIGVATGEHAHNRVMFKQFFQADALSFCQLDACRLGGVNEVLAVVLMAAKFGIPICPHGGGVGLCEYVQHISMFDYIAVSASLENRRVEYSGHLHEHFVDPVRIRGGHYLLPNMPGYSATLKPSSLADHSFPDGPVWRAARKESAAL